MHFLLPRGIMYRDEWLACPLYFIVHSQHTQRSQHNTLTIAQCGAHPKCCILLTINNYCC